MEKIYTGKTKDIFKNEEGHYVLKFKDDVTGENGVFDPGANTVGLTIDGVGQEGLKMTTYFFELLNARGIKTHYVSSDISNNTMTVIPAKVFGKGLEVICRFKAVGSFIKRYGDYIESGSDLDAYVEMTLKDDERCDPLITKDALVALNIMSDIEYDTLVQSVKDISMIIKEELASKDITLYDIKLEFGKVGNDIVLIDEISGGNMRAFHNDEAILPLDLYNFITK